MKDTIIEQIERRARLDHGGDVNKAAAEYFRDHPTESKCYTKENRFCAPAKGTLYYLRRRCVIERCIERTHG